MTFLKLPFFDTIADAETFLLAGAGGGFDIFSGPPLYFGLKTLANLSFSRPSESSAKRLGMGLVEITAQTKGFERYFPAFHLTRWLEAQGE